MTRFDRSGAAAVGGPGAEEQPSGERAIRGRGATDNPANRFDRLHVVAEETWSHPDDPGPRTIFLRDATRNILSRNDSPDVGFDVSVNPYRGCEHGCIYCYARPTHEYLGFSAGLDFETKIVVKHDAPALLRAALLSPRWMPRPIAMSGVTDPYQPAERRLRLTRGCLEVLAEFRNPVMVVTKNHLVTRDVDLLGELALHGAAAVAVSVTSLRPELQRLLEPRTATPARRLDAIARLAEAGVPVRVMVAPVIPGLTDEEIPAILTAAADAGARSASYIMLRLPHGVKDLFARWLDTHFPDRRDRVLNRVRSVRSGCLNDSHFGVRMRGQGVYAEQIGRLFAVARRRAGLEASGSALRTDAFRRPDPDGQLSLFES
jgi:DNA repair photolyase